jgi:VanZ family protein
MLLPLRYPRAWLALGWALIIGAVIVSLAPGGSLPSTGASDKLEHAAAYALMTLWFAGIYPRSRYPMIGIALCTLGILLEWAQGAMHMGRQRDFYDVVANTSGIVAGLIAARLGLGGWAQRVEGWVWRA